MSINSTIINDLRKQYETRASTPNSILNAPGICNGLVNLYHRFCLKAMKNADVPFTAAIARHAALKISLLHQELQSGNTKTSKRFDQLCYFQSPSSDQPEGSACHSTPGIKIDDIAGINRSYAKSLNKEEDKLETVELSQHFAACVGKKPLKDLLAYYLPLHPNELIRVASANHVIAIGFHPEGGMNVISVFDPNNRLEEPLLIIEHENLECALESLIAAFQKVFYSDTHELDCFEFNDRFTLSLKLYSPPGKSVHADEISGAQKLVQLLEDYQVDVEDQDMLGFDSLFICSEYNQVDTIKSMLTLYGQSRLKDAISQKQGKIVNPDGKKIQNSPLDVAVNHGHQPIVDLMVKTLTESIKIDTQRISFFGWND